MTGKDRGYIVHFVASIKPKYGALSQGREFCSECVGMCENILKQMKAEA